MARKRIDPTQPVSAWSEKDAVSGKVADALVVILRSRGCYWSKRSGCLMCGYNNDCLDTVTDGDLVTQFRAAMEKYSGQEYIKIYTSGSFLDPNEVGPEAGSRIMEMIGEKGARVLVESRPEFVSAANLERCMKGGSGMDIAVGLETANDGIRARCINKGFSYADFERACETAHSLGAGIRTYLLLKPPYLTESQSINDALKSIEIAGPLSDTISVNPMNVQRGTVVEGLWKKGLYRPPWLWSLMKILEEGSKLTDARLVSAPSGGGSMRGVHNCGKCDDALLKAVETFSLEGSVSALRMPMCECRARWLEYLDAEPFCGTAGNLERLLPPQ